MKKPNKPMFVSAFLPTPAIEMINLLAPLRQAFRKQKKDIRFVGGCVRDWLNSGDPKDIDLCTDATPQEACAIYEGMILAGHDLDYYLTGLAHGTISVKIGGIIFEITTLRTDVETDGRHAVVEYTTDWIGDLARRDLTMNAMALSMDGELYDPFGGWEALKDRRVVFVGNASDRIKEDYLRILRFFRFFGRYGSVVDQFQQTQEIEALTAIRENVEGLKQISVERIWMEMKKIVSGPSATTVLQLMQQTGVMEVLGMPAYTDYWRMLEVSGFTNDPVVLLVALNYVSFLDTPDYFLDWHLSNDEIDLANFLFMYGITADRKKSWTVNDLKRLIYVEEERPEFVIALGKLNQIDTTALEGWAPPKSPFSGLDVKPLVAYPKEIGFKLKLMRQFWFESDFTMTVAELLAKLKDLGHIHV